MLDFILGFLQTPALIVGLVAFLGLILQQKKAGDIFSGTIKTAIGLLIISAGSGILVGEILPFVGLFQDVTGLQGFATSSESVVAATQTTIAVVARTSSLIMAIGFIVNIVLARITPLKYVFLTGHMMWILSVTVAWALYALGLNDVMIIVLGSILQGVFQTMLPAISQPIVRELTGSNDFAVAHLTTLGTTAAGYIGGLVGNKEKDAEELDLPDSLEFFKDTAIAISLIMIIFFVGLAIVGGPSVVAPYAQGQNYIIFMLLKALGFTGGVLVLLYGVRMFLGEIVPAFKGIADKVIPNAIPALDVPSLFGFAPNSLMIGFISAVVGMLVAMVASSLAFKTAPLVSIIGAFFTGGVAGIFGNARGGTRGAIVAGFVYGFLLIFLSGMAFVVFDFGALGSAGVGHDCIDAIAIMLLFKYWYIGVPLIAVAYLWLCRQEIAYQKAQN